VSGGSTSTATQRKVSLKKKIALLLLQTFNDSKMPLYNPSARQQQITYFRNRPVTMIAFSSETASSFSSVNFSNKDDIRTIQNDINVHLVDPVVQFLGKY
jgi:hypothetical protein